MGSTKTETHKAILRRWGATIAARRKELGWSQEQLAQALGTHYTSINRWEGGHQEPSFDQKFALGRVLGIDARDLFDLGPEP